MSDIENINIQAEHVSVVIATLGGESLRETINTLNLSTIVPDEILICIPRGESKENCPLDHNVKIIETNDRGQVKQRIDGFKLASCEYVMQLDDDIYVEKKCIERLVSAIKLHGNNVAVAPSFINVETGRSVYEKPNRNYIIDTIVCWLMNGKPGYEPGKIDKSGTPIGVDTKNVELEDLNIEWLAGGCVMHRKENLVLDNYYPYRGKAFGEDIIHSIALRNKGIKLLVEAKAICSLEVIPSSIFSITELFYNIRSDYQVRLYYLSLMSRKSIRIYVYYFLCIIGYLIKKIK